MEFTENTLIRGIFTHAPPHSSLAPRSVPPTAERGVGSYDLLYQNSAKKYEDDLEH